MSLTSDALKKLQEEASGAGDVAPTKPPTEPLTEPLTEPPCDSLSGAEPADTSEATEIEKHDEASVKPPIPAPNAEDESTALEETPAESPTLPADAPCLSVNENEADFAPELNGVIGSQHIEIQDGLAVDDTHVVEAWHELAALADLKSLEHELRDAVPTLDPLEQNGADGKADGAPVSERPESPADNTPSTTPPVAGGEAADCEQNTFVYLDHAEPTPAEEFKPEVDLDALDEASPTESGPAEVVGYDPIIPSVDDWVAEEMIDDAGLDQSHGSPSTDRPPTDESDSPTSVADDTSITPFVKPIETDAPLPSLDVGECEPAEPAEQSDTDTDRFEIPHNIPDQRDIADPNLAQCAADEPPTAAQGPAGESDTVSLDDVCAHTNLDHGVLVAGQITPRSSNAVGPTHKIDSDAIPHESPPDLVSWQQQLASLLAMHGVQQSLDQCIARLKSPNDELPGTLFLTSMNSACRAPEIVGLLSQQLGAQGKKVLLVDADLQEQSLTRAIGGLGLLGFCDAVGGTSDVESVVRTTEVPGVAFLPCGDDVQGVSRDPSVLSQSILVQTLRSCQERYDHVLIDGGTQGSSLVTQLAANCQATVLLVAQHEANLDEIVAVSESMRHFAEHIAGCILCGFPDLQPDHSESSLLESTPEQEPTTLQDEKSG